VREISDSRAPTSADARPRIIPSAGGANQAPHRNSRALFRPRLLKGSVTGPERGLSGASAGPQRETNFADEKEAKRPPVFFLFFFVFAFFLWMLYCGFATTVKRRRRVSFVVDHESLVYCP
jgi:hypothetical protein